MPHIAEELSLRMGYIGEGKFVMSKPLPSESLIGDAAEASTNATAIFEAAGRLRNLKAEYNLSSRKDMTLRVKGAKTWLGGELKVLALLVGCEAIEIDEAYDAPKGTPAALTPVGEFYMPMDGLIDIEAEKARLTKEIAKIQGEKKKSEGKLGNASFVDRAPAEVVEQEKQRLEEWNAKLAQLEEMLSSLS